MDIDTSNDQSRDLAGWIALLESLYREQLSAVAVVLLDPLGRAEVVTSASVADVPHFLRTVAESLATNDDATAMDPAWKQ